MSRVRDALVTSVACTGEPPAASPESRQTRKLSMVPKQSSPRSARARAGHVVQEPRELRAAEVRIEHEAGRLLDRLLVARGAQLGTARRRPAVLPHDRAVDRAARRALPDERRLALVRDADRLDRAAGHARRPERLAHGVLNALPDLLRVVLDEPGFREMLAKLARGAAQRRASRVHEEGCRSGGALIDGEEVRGIHAAD
jgi:hypothetical protein